MELESRLNRASASSRRRGVGNTECAIDINGTYTSVVGCKVFMLSVPAPWQEKSGKSSAAGSRAERYSWFGHIDEHIERQLDG